MNFDTCNCYLCCTNQARSQASSKFSSINEVWVWVYFRNDEAKKPQWYAVVKKILLRNLTAWFSIPPILPFDCPVKLDVPLKLVAVKECHGSIINCISIFLGTPGTPTVSEWLAKVRWISYWGYCLLAEVSFPWYSSGGRKSPLNTRGKGPLLARKLGYGIDEVMQPGPGA